MRQQEAAELHVSNVHVVLRLSRFGSGFRERVETVCACFGQLKGGARIAVPRCSRVYIWSAQTRHLSVRVHQNHTLPSTLLKYIHLERCAMFASRGDPALYPIPRGEIAPSGSYKVQYTV